jgi:hypothetical protein
MIRHNLKKNSTKRQKIKHNHKQKKQNKKHTRRQNMKGGKSPLEQGTFSKQFIPKELNNVPFIPSGGAAKIGAAYPHKYYALSGDLSGMNNHYEQSYPVQSGGSIIPEPLLQLSRGVVFNMQNLYNNYVGQPTYISKDPSPLTQPIANEKGDLNVIPIDIDDIYMEARQKAANFNA